MTKERKRKKSFKFIGYMTESCLGDIDIMKKFGHDAYDTPLIFVEPQGGFDKKVRITIEEII